MNPAAAITLGVAIAIAPVTLRAQHAGHDAAHGHAGDSTSGAAVAAQRSAPPATHTMWMQPLGAWHVMGMAQVIPAVTTATPWRKEKLLNASGLYATAPAVMVNLASPRSRLVLRATANLEAWTQPDGELTFGAWGEGFIDSRHPHTLLHEAMLTANWWDVAGGALSLSAGKGFAPYGTDDPMGRPALKYPTNHHLSQVLERWTLNGVYLRDGWGIEMGLFGGTEPEGPYDLGNIESFADSWSARLSKRLAAGDAVASGPFAPWELSTSYASVVERHHGAKVRTRLYNAALRHDQSLSFGRLYALVEASRSEPEAAKGHYSLLAESLLGVGDGSRHEPYARVEYATRPEYERRGAPASPEFFRYDHDSHEIAATRWLISTAGYSYATSAFPASVRLFTELQHHRVAPARGAVDPTALFGGRSFWSVSAGARVFLGGGPMRMGSYGALDPMTAAMRISPRAADRHAH